MPPHGVLKVAEIKIPRREGVILLIRYRAG